MLIFKTLIQPRNYDLFALILPKKPNLFLDLNNARSASALRIANVNINTRARKPSQSLPEYRQGTPKGINKTLRAWQNKTHFSRWNPFG